METAKIQLSTDELRLMLNSDLILTKNRIIEKIHQGLGNLALQMQQETINRRLVVAAFDLVSPKISKGEKYMGLPYLILDYPRLFDKENILAIRTFFWWGHFCSITLHIKGIFLLPISKKLLTAIDILAEANFYISVSGDEWSHDITGKTYQPLTDIPTATLSETLHEADFLKLSAKVDFDQWDAMERKLFNYFISLVSLIEV